MEMVQLLICGLKISVEELKEIHYHEHRTRVKGENSQVSNCKISILMVRGTERRDIDLNRVICFSYQFKFSYCYLQTTLYFGYRFQRSYSFQV